jgi:hypothetical protein
MDNLKSFFYCKFSPFPTPSFSSIYFTKTKKTKVKAFRKN